jgi:hypothetical protein
MSAENHIVSLQQVKEYMGVAGFEKDSMLSEWLDIVSDEIERFCQSKFKPQAIENEIQSGDGTAFLFPEYIPILGLATGATSDLQVRDAANGTWRDLVASLEQVLTDKNMPFIEFADGVFPRGTRNIKVSYRCGYELIPGDIRRTAMEMMQMMWNESKQGADWLGKRSKTQPETGSARSLEFMTMKPEWERTLDRYRKVHFA